VFLVRITHQDAIAWDIHLHCSGQCKELNIERLKGFRLVIFVRELSKVFVNVPVFTFRFNSLMDITYLKIIKQGRTPQ